MSIRRVLVAPQPPPPAPAARWTPARAGGIVFMALWVAAGIGLFFYLVGAWDAGKVARYGPNYLSGLWVTLSLVGLAVLLGALVSLPVALARMSADPLLFWAASAYIYVFRGTPLLAQLFLVYYGLGSFRPQLEAVGLWTFFRDAWNCALFTFTLNTSAYQAEILRGALQSVPRGQREAAAALGLKPLQTFRRVLLPQALIVALRPYGNEIILLVKGSAIVAIVTVFDLMGETRRAFSRTFDFQTYLWAAIFYLLVVETLRNVWQVLERRLTRHLRR